MADEVPEGKQTDAEPTPAATEEIPSEVVENDKQEVDD